MDLFEKIVEMATELNSNAQIIVRNDENRDWFIHYFIYDIENGHKTIYQKYTNDLNKVLKEIEGMLEASKKGALLFNKEIKPVKINKMEA